MAMRISASLIVGAVCLFLVGLTGGLMVFGYDFPELPAGQRPHVTNEAIQQGALAVRVSPTGGALSRSPVTAPDDSPAELRCHSAYGAVPDQPSTQEAQITCVQVGGPTGWQAEGLSFKAELGAETGWSPLYTNGEIKVGRHKLEFERRANGSEVFGGEWNATPLPHQPAIMGITTQTNFQRFDVQCPWQESYYEYMCAIVLEDGFPPILVQLATHDDVVDVTLTMGTTGQAWVAMYVQPSLDLKGDVRGTVYFAD